MRCFTIGGIVESMEQKEKRKDKWKLRREAQARERLGDRPAVYRGWGEAGY